ncbi:MAG TPA: DUF192 domain-containing protein [Thermoanaerobaculia bacterium]|nr:DUF192 domain-containing protein [Thermoanaerobaculia bacterium]
MRIALVLLLALSCSNPPSDASGGASPASGAGSVAEAATAPQDGPRVTFPDGHLVRLEIANDGELRAQGLMYRDHLPPDRGMLFLFPEDGDYPFWMKNTRIPLDMIWIDASHRIAAVKFEVPPCKADPCPSYPPNARARYVLEVAGGVARQHGLKAGDSLRFEGIDGYEAR